jgi:hypothetical protein
MKNRVVVSREVHVPEVYFKNEGRLAIFPRRMELDGRDYRLQFDDTRHAWTLVDMTL